MSAPFQSSEDIDETRDAAAAESCPALPDMVEDGVALQRNPPSERGSGQAGEFSGVHWLLRRLGNRWTFPIIDTLRHGPMRFAKLKRALDPVSQRMLTLSLRKLEQDDLIYRQEIAGQPPQVTYGLTSLGIALVDRLTEFDAWLAAYQQLLVPGRN